MAADKIKHMTVGDLIAYLEQFDHDTPVVCHANDYSGGDDNFICLQNAIDVYANGDEDWNAIP